MALRYSDLRLDAASLQTLPDGSVKVVGQLTRPGIFSYRNPDGTERKEYRAPAEVFRADAMQSFAASPVTINHPLGHKVTPASWRQDAVGNLGENIREEGGVLVADIYLRDADAIARVRSGDLKAISCGYRVDYDPTPGETPEGLHYDGVQKNIVGNHVALLPQGVAPRGGDVCTLRLDSTGDELRDDSEKLLQDSVPIQNSALEAQIAALQGELAKARTDASEVPSLRTQLATTQATVAALSPERLDALVEERATLITKAAAFGVKETKGLTNAQIKRRIVATQTPELATRADSLSDETVETLLAIYKTAEVAPHPTMKAAVAVVVTDPVRADAKPVKTLSQLREDALRASLAAWKQPSSDNAEAMLRRTDPQLQGAR